MRDLIRIACIAFGLALATAHAAEPTTVEEAIRQNLLLKHPTPEYPYEARRLKLSGSGLYQLKFDYESGQLREVHIVQSTRKPVLDEAIISTLKRWQAKPRSLHSLILAVTFRGPNFGSHFSLLRCRDSHPNSMTAMHWATRSARFDLDALFVVRRREAAT